ncbi:MAG: hypothetical protein LBM75_11610 [Myxococcales bacterium]|jgi:CRISPR-associated protein Csb3|nr:hypothetical protein [Myxococcales bacterium]
MSFRVNVDLANPGQVLACCGLFELAHRFTKGGAGARFEFGRHSSFHVEADCMLGELLEALSSAKLQQLDESDETQSPLCLTEPFSLRLDWWRDELAGGGELKTWAGGTMDSTRIERSMLAWMGERLRSDPDGFLASLFDVGAVVPDADNPKKKVEPFYFDARRSGSSHSRDVGFSPNDLKASSIAHPAVEALCLIGLQRFRPATTDQPRVFDYWCWSTELPIEIAPAAFAGELSTAHAQHCRFECWFRTGQRKHKAFRPAALIP